MKIQYVVYFNDLPAMPREVASEALTLAKELAYHNPDSSVKVIEWVFTDESNKPEKDSRRKTEIWPELKPVESY